MIFMRSRKCLVMVARFEANTCGVSIDGIDSRIDLWED